MEESSEDQRSDNKEEIDNQQHNIYGHFDYNPAAINMYHDNQTSQNAFDSYTTNQENRQPLMKSNFNHLRQPLHPIQQFPMQAPHQSALQRKRTFQQDGESSMAVEEVYTPQTKRVTKITGGWLFRECENSPKCHETVKEKSKGVKHRFSGPG